MRLDFDEIKSGDAFEDLTAVYLREQLAPYCLRCTVAAPAVGQDGGCDLIAELECSDSIGSFTRKWVIQCKFYKDTVPLSQMQTVNIPSLIHQHGAVGYLLIVRNKLSKSIVTMLEQLEQNCQFGYLYRYWNGEQFLRALLSAPIVVRQQFFPKYEEYISSKGPS